MIKQVLVFVAVLSSLLLGGYALQNYILQMKSVNTAFPLFKIYGVNWLLSFCTYVIIRSVKNQIPDQVGNLFLVSVVVKPGVLILVFGHLIFEAESFKIFERLAFILPFFICLLTEVISIHGILKSSNQSNE